VVDVAVVCPGTARGTLWRGRTPFIIETGVRVGGVGLLLDMLVDVLVEDEATDQGHAAAAASAASARYSPPELARRRSLPELARRHSLPELARQRKRVRCGVSRWR
jgi:hypothetical protein